MARVTAWSLKLQVHPGAEKVLRVRRCERKRCLKQARGLQSPSKQLLTCRCDLASFAAGDAELKDGVGKQTAFTHRDKDQESSE